MNKYSLWGHVVLLCVAYVMCAPAAKDQGQAVELVPAPEDVENIEASASKKTKRGAYGGSFGYGFGYYPYSYGHYPYGHYGGYYGHYPYFSLGYGLHHGYGGWYW